MRPEDRPDPLRPPEGYPGSQPEEDELDDGLCRVNLAAAFQTQRLCRQLAEWRYMLACPNEHVQPTQACAQHDAQFPGRTWTCGNCEQACKDGRCPLQHPHGKIMVSVVQRTRTGPEPGPDPVQSALDRYF